MTTDINERLELSKLWGVIDKLPIECLKSGTYRKYKDFIVFNNGVNTFVDDKLYGIKDNEGKIIASGLYKNAKAFLRVCFDYEFHVHTPTGLPYLYVSPQINEPFHVPLKFVTQEELITDLYPKPKYTPFYNGPPFRIPPEHIEILPYPYPVYKKDIIPSITGGNHNINISKSYIDPFEKVKST